MNVLDVVLTKNVLESYVLPESFTIVYGDNVICTLALARLLHELGSVKRHSAIMVDLRRLVKTGKVEETSVVEIKYTNNRSKEYGRSCYLISFITALELMSNYDVLFGVEFKKKFFTNNPIIEKNDKREVVNLGLVKNIEKIIEVNKKAKDLTLEEFYKVIDSNFRRFSGEQLVNVVNTIMQELDPGALNEISKHCEVLTYNEKFKLQLASIEKQMQKLDDKRMAMLLKANQDIAVILGKEKPTSVPMSVKKK